MTRNDHKMGKITMFCKDCSRDISLLLYESRSKMLEKLSKHFELSNKQLKGKFTHLVLEDIDPTNILKNMIIRLKK